MGYELAVQKFIYDALTNNATLMGAVAGVYDSVPQNEIFPYVTIGEDNHTQWDTQTSSGSDCTITIHTWSRARGRVEAKTIQGMIYDILHKKEFFVAGWDVLSVDCETSISFVDNDGLTRHGVQTFRILLDGV